MNKAVEQNPRHETPVTLRLLLRPKEAAAALAMSTSTLWLLTDRGEIASIRIGKLVRYDPRDLTAWIDRQKRNNCGSEKPGLCPEKT